MCLLITYEVKQEQICSEYGLDQVEIVDPKSEVYQIHEFPKYLSRLQSFREALYFAKMSDEALLTAIAPRFSTKIMISKIYNFIYHFIYQKGAIELARDEDRERLTAFQRAAKRGKHRPSKIIIISRTGAGSHRSSRETSKRERGCKLQCILAQFYKHPLIQSGCFVRNCKS